nr:MAG TPA: hypothetical protein [Caudoviricetes sp.]
MITLSFQKVNVPSMLLTLKLTSSLSPQSFRTLLIVFQVLSFRDFNVFRATTARIFSNRMQLLISQTLPKYDFPPKECIRH